MTTIYFVRHAESDINIRDGESRPLTEKGLKDAKNIIPLFREIEIDRVYSSPYKRAVDTVSPLANIRKLEIEVIDDFKERRSDTVKSVELSELIKRQWDDFTYTLSDGECYSDVQSRNIKALARVLSENEGGTVVIGTHGISLCTMIHFYHPISLKNLGRILLTMPYIARMRFDGGRFVDFEELL